MDKEILVSWMEEGMISIPHILLTKYNQIGLNEIELGVILHLHSFIERGKDFPTPEEISGRMTISAMECSTLLRKLMQQHIISIEEKQSEANIRYEKYSLRPLWTKLADEMLYELKHKDMEQTLLNEHNLYTIFETEFGRPLSPLECETLAMWLDEDHQNPSIIKAALQEAVLSNKLNFRYIDRILFEWKKNGITTIEQARLQGKKFRQHRKKTSEPVQKTSKAVPFYNWLE